MKRIFILLELFQFSFCSFIFKDYMSKVMNDLQNQSVSNNQIGLDFFEKDLAIKYQQIKNLTKLNECMPNSVAYNGTCIYFSSQNQKLSWIQAEKFCRRIPLNNSLLVIENEHQLEFIRRKLIQLREVENPIDDLIFYVGYKYDKNKYKWLNNKIINQKNTFKLGNCGSLVLLNDSLKLVLRSSPCESTNSRFACKYTIDSCYKNKCLNGGKCINLVETFYCDCPIFYQGDNCERWNSKFIQTIIACSMALIFFIYLMSKRISFIYQLFKNFDLVAHFEKFKLKKTIKPIEMISLFKLILKAISVVSLVHIQLVFAHSWSLFGKFNVFNFKIIKSLKPIFYFCHSYETYYLFLELIYLGFFIIFFLFYITFCHTKRCLSSNQNRVLASVIYIVYTNDIIKMFFYYLVSDKKIPFVSSLDGIITDFIIQILQIVLIGLKFFPLLLCLDSNYILSDLFCLLYSFTIWLLDLSTRTLCNDNSRKYLDKLSYFLKKSNLSLTFSSSSLNNQIDLIENLPFYFCLSFLVISYFFLFIDRIIKVYFNTDIPKSAKKIIYSRQIVCLYSVAFMIVYYLTTTGIRLASLFGDRLVNLINISFQTLFKESKPLLSDLLMELLLTFSITTSIILIQLILSLRAFRLDLRELNSYRAKFSEYLKKHTNEYSSIILNSLHYSGYFIAHIIYAYFIFSFLIFSLIIFTKIIHYLPIKPLIQIFLPLLLVLFFRFVVFKYLEKIIFTKFQNSTLYYVYSYFNFFSDCLLGLISCMSRVWKTSLIAIFMLPRLDKTLFNDRNQLLLNILDPSHYCYLNYVKKECLFNT